MEDPEHPHSSSKQSRRTRQHYMCKGQLVKQHNWICFSSLSCSRSYRWLTQRWLETRLFPLVSNFAIDSFVVWMPSGDNPPDTQSCPQTFCERFSHLYPPASRHNLGSCCLSQLGTLQSNSQPFPRVVLINCFFYTWHTLSL